MARIKIQLSPEQLDRVRRDWHQHQHAVVRRRLHILWLRHKGYKVDPIMEVLDCSRRTVQNTFALFDKKGLEALYDYEPHGPSSNLDPYIEILKKHFAENPVRTSAEAALVVERITGIKKSPSALRTWLKKKLALSFSKLVLYRRKPIRRRKGRS